MFGCIHVIIRRHACKLNQRSQRETYITDGKHASLGICVRGNTHPLETHITVTPYAYGMYRMRIHIWYDRTRMVWLFVPYEYAYTILLLFTCNI